MRDFIQSGTLGLVRPLATTVLALAMGCNSPTYLAITAEQDALGDSSTGLAATSTSGDALTTETTGSASTSSSASGDAEASGDASGTNDMGPVSATGETTASEDTDETTLPAPSDLNLPSIVSVKVPAKVYAAGPAQLEVQTENAAAVQVELDGVALGELADAGDGLFVGTLPVRGAIDNGFHEVKVTAQQDPFKDVDAAFYEVSTPKPGTMAWFKAGPAGSRTNRIALTAEGDVLEAGQVEINKITRPSLRKRSGLTGAELWSVTLDTREGSVADLAVLPDGRVWAAMNVRKPGEPSPQPRIALFDAAGKFTGVEAFGDLGQGVRGIAADAEGGCFAAGFASAGSDLDIAYWRVTAAGVQTLAGTWDYLPEGGFQHTFSDFATDVVVTGDVAWVVGTSNGWHDPDPPKRLRGVLVPMDLHTGKVVDSPIVAPKSAFYTQSVFFGAGRHPLGVLVTGYGCDDACTNFQIETSLYGPTGLRLWHVTDAAGSGLRYGSDVVLDSQGRALVAGTVTEKGALRGYAFAHLVGGEEVLPLLGLWFPASAPSEALGVLVDAYDRIFAAGYITANGSTQARLTLIHG